MSDALPFFIPSRRRDRSPTPLSYQEVRIETEFAVTSHDRRLRVGALRLLAACAEPGSNSEESRGDSLGILQLCLAAEKVPLDVAGVRERIVKTRKVGSMATKDIDEDAVRLASQWLLGADFIHVPYRDSSMTTNFFRSASNQPASTLGPCCRVPCHDYGTTPRCGVEMCL
jgi:hypothetical protein